MDPLDLKFALSPTLAAMNSVQFYAKYSTKIFGSTAVSAVIHLFGALTCATCWTIFGPALALLFGSSGTAVLATLRPYTPIALAASALGLGYSLYQLAQNHENSGKLPYRMAAAFTIFSMVGWFGSSAYAVFTLVKG